MGSEPPSTGQVHLPVRPYVRGKLMDGIPQAQALAFFLFSAFTLGFLLLFTRAIFSYFFLQGKKPTDPFLLLHLFRLYVCFRLIGMMGAGNEISYPSSPGLLQTVSGSTLVTDSVRE